MLSEILAVSFTQKQMKFLVCPKCGVRRFYVKDANGNRVLVNVTREFEIVPVSENESLEGCDLEVLYCLGCSWKGTKRKLVKYILN